MLPFFSIQFFFFVKESGDHWNVELMSRSPISFCQLMSVFMSESYYYYCSSVVHLENRNDDNLQLCRTTFSLLSVLSFHMKLRIIFNICEDLFWNFEGVLLNLYVALGWVAIFIILSILIHEHERAFHLLMSSSTSFFAILNILLCKSLCLLCASIIIIKWSWHFYDTGVSSAFQALPS